ncbi:hypothetical protein TIFTF001_036563 [Ficus carica]|uniref:Bulb-type lectin domain-containing protein n=1 Tax=Ficus carica TaxID=3494 RepID=A0AA88JB83_FICCA|nr:hypothetical protein TIFTF001_036563 [Ficus carica]
MCLAMIKTSFSLEADTISVGDVISTYSTLVSQGGKFEMGLCTPNYYLRIWYRKDPSWRAVWVANREKLVSLSSELRISDGNLVLFDESKITIWSTNVKSSTTSQSVQAVLLDTGNLVLNDVSNSTNLLWESFDNPTHTWLLGASLGYNKVTKKSQVLTSWKNSEDLAPSLFSLELNPSAISFSIMWDGSKSYWDSGSWDGDHEMRI